MTNPVIHPRPRHSRRMFDHETTAVRNLERGRSRNAAHRDQPSEVLHVWPYKKAVELERLMASLDPAASPSSQPFEVVHSLPYHSVHYFYAQYRNRAGYTSGTHRIPISGSDIAHEYGVTETANPATTESTACARK